jgi:two-component system NtrC family sensor kinase
MQKPLFPMRFKILIILLSVITIVVSTITFTMANLFREDKTAYIHDLTSVIALHTAQEARSLLTGYRQKLQVFAQIMSGRDLPQDRKDRLLERLFGDFKEFLSVTLYRDGKEQAAVYDAQTMKTAGVSKDDLISWRRKYPLPFDRIRSGELFIVNSTMSEKMPCLTLAVANPDASDDEPAVIAAVIRLDELLRLASRTKVFETFVIDSGGNLLAHTDPRVVVRHERASWLPALTGRQEQHTMGTTLEYAQNGVQMVGGFSPVEFSGLVAGVQIPKTAAYLTARELLGNLVVVALALIVISAIVSVFWSRLITRPIEKLSAAARVVGTGRFDIRLELSSRDEIGDLALSFNQMASELAVREKALKDSQTALIHSEKMAAFGQLGAGIAHEVKNPLAGILGFAQLSLRKIDADNALYQNLVMIEKEAKRSKTIIENLLKFARQEKMEFEKVSINTVVEESATIMRHQLELHKVKLELDPAPELPPVSGNANQLQQVLMNLFLNAQQAMDGTAGAIRVTTRLLGPDTVEVRVIDSGPGITEDVQAKLFEPFFTTKPSGKGTGLGLSVSYGIIKEHRGDIRVESRPGAGATFIITIPIKPRPYPAAAAERG